jgi:peptidoglycan/LPS O-acetylase OafA/YrhL
LNKNYIEKKRIPFDILDSIRGIAALYVTIAHCRATLWIGGSEFARIFPREGWNLGDYLMFGTSMLTRLAVEFVIVFFVLSGFSIAHSLSSNRSALQFYKRRFIRIYPSYVVALIWAGLVFIITRYWHPEWYDGTMVRVAAENGTDIGKLAFIRTMEMNNYFDWEVMLKNLFYMPGRGFITPFWTLTYEVIFYLLAPFLLRKVNLYAIVSVILFLANFIMPGRIASIGLPLYIYEFLFLYNIYFAIGVVLYKNYEKASQVFQSFSKAALLSFMLLALALMYGANFYFKIESVYSFLASALLSILLICYFLKYNVRIKWLMGIGKFSYTLYITHFATIFLYLGIYWLVVKPHVPYILNYFIWMPAVLVCLLVAYLQYLLVERNTKRLLNKLRKKSALQVPVS